MALLYFDSMILKLWSRDPWEVPKNFSGGPWGQNYFHINTKMLLALFTLILLRMYSRVFQRLHDTYYHNRLKAEVDMRIQLSPIKPCIKEICILSLNSKNIILFYNSVFMLACNIF